MTSSNTLPVDSEPTAPTAEKLISWEKTLSFDLSRLQRNHPRLGEIVCLDPFKLTDESCTAMGISYAFRINVTPNGMKVPETASDCFGISVQYLDGPLQTLDGITVIFEAIGVKTSYFFNGKTALLERHVSIKKLGGFGYPDFMPNQLSRLREYGFRTEPIQIRVAVSMSYREFFDWRNVLRKSHRRGVPVSQLQLPMITRLFREAVGDHSSATTDVEETSDFTLVSQEGNRFPVHKLILRTNAPTFFGPLFRSEPNRKEQVLDQYSTACLTQVLRCIYEQPDWSQSVSPSTSTDLGAGQYCPTIQQSRLNFYAELAGCGQFFVLPKILEQAEFGLTQLLFSGQDLQSSTGEGLLRHRESESHPMPTSKKPVLSKTQRAFVQDLCATYGFNFLRNLMQGPKDATTENVKMSLESKESPNVERES